MQIIYGIARTLEHAAEKLDHIMGFTKMRFEYFVLIYEQDST